jgi:hypothetical protein
METIAALSGIGAAFGLSTSAGLNAYIPLLIVALAGRFPADNPLLQLQSPYDTLTSWWVIGVLMVLLLIEILVDKVPAVDTVNDVIQTAIRPAAGALLFAANANVITDLSPVLAIVAGILLAGSVHATKGVVRPAVTATTAGTGNWAVSTAEDVVATLMSLLALVVPILVAVVALFMVTLLLIFWVRRRRRRRNKLAF